MLEQLPATTTVFANLWISVGLGFLVGLQRESRRSALGGIRTFPLVSVAGTLCGLIATYQGVWIVPAGLVAVTSLLIVGNVVRLRGPDPPDPGLTTEVAVVVMYLVGALLAFGYREVAIAVGGGVAVILQFKGQLHGFTERLGQDDVHAIMRFALLTLVILPVLPDQTYGPYEVLNPRQVWWMVVLIVGIGLGGYLAYKFLGDRMGHVLAGSLGGLVSSTATTVSYARRVGQSTRSMDPRPAALIILSASTLAFARIIVEVAIVAPDLLRAAMPPLLMVLAPLALFSIWSGWRESDAPRDASAPGNPSELKTALVFGFLYALILIGTAAARDYFGDRGLVAVAALSGLTDVDAITLSSARLFRLGRFGADEASKVVLIAALSNLTFKGAIAAVVGGRKLGVRIGIPFGVALAVGAFILVM